MNTFSFNQRIYNTFMHENNVYVEVFSVSQIKIIKLKENDKVYSTLLLKDFSEMFQKGEQLMFCKFAAASQNIKIDGDELVRLNQSDTKYYNSSSYRKPIESSTYYEPIKSKDTCLDLLNPDSYDITAKPKPPTEIANRVNTFLFG